MSRMRILLTAAIIIFFAPIVNAACPDPELGKYPGWAVRFNGTVNLSDIARAEDFEVKVSKIHSENAINVDIYILGSFYTKGSVLIGPDGIFKNPDIRVELVGSDGADVANLTLYTPQRANVTLNLTNIFAFKTLSDRKRLFPNEKFQMEFTINNSGELPAKNVFIYPEFGDFQVVSTDVRSLSLCQGSTYDFKYVLLTPEARKTFNYSLYLRVEYSDENIQIPRKSEYTEISSTEVEIVPAVLEITRDITNWTTATTERELTVEVVLNNSGESGAFNIQWSDSPPLDFLVTQGTTSWSGKLQQGSQRFLTYKVISDDPIICKSISTATYEDRFGNEYIAFSGNATAKFAPYLTLHKKLDGVSSFLSPDNSEAYGNKTIRLGDRVNVSVVVINKGNAIARGVIINDSSGRLISGTNRLTNDLKPGEEASFSYIAEVDSKDLNFTAHMGYLDIDLDAFNASKEIEKETPNYCSRKLKSVNYTIGQDLNLLYPEITINSSDKLDVLSEFEVEYSLTLKNNGTDGVHDIYAYIDTSDLNRAPLRYGGAILKGQPIYYMKELKAGEEQNFTLILRAPTVENTTNFLITARVNYTDFFGKVHTINATTSLNVTKPKPGFAIVEVVKKGLSLTISAPNETEIGEYGIGVISLASVGFAPLEEVEFSLSLPPGVELFSNDTQWEGRFEAQLRRENQTWFGYVDDIMWKGNLSTREEKSIEFLVRGTKAGLYVIPYNLTFDSDILTGELESKVRGPRLEIKKILEMQSITLGKEIGVIVEVRNIGETTAKEVRLADKPPANFQVAGNTSSIVRELEPGEATGIKYKMKSTQAGSYTSGVATVQWTDDLGNEYLLESQDFGVEVLGPIEFPELTKPPETTPPPTPPETPAGPILTRRDVVITSIFTIIVMTILVKLIALSRPSSKG